MSKLQTLLICIYGDSGIGKTVDCGYSFSSDKPNEVVFLAAPGALNSIKTTCGYSPTELEVTDLATATELLKGLARDKNTKVLVVDDFSFMVEETVRLLRIEDDKLVASGKEKANAFRIWTKLKDMMEEFRSVARRANIHVIVSCWETTPDFDSKGNLISAGRPKLPGQAATIFPPMCDMVIHAFHDPEARPWRASYSSGGNYIAKDRLNIISRCGKAPLNIAEIIRASDHPYNPQRSNGVSEEKVEEISRLLPGKFTGSAVSIMNQEYKKLIQGGASVRCAKWTLRDAQDRATIRFLLEQHNDSFIAADDAY